jgi:hypothetical protein
MKTMNSMAAAMVRTPFRKTQLLRIKNNKTHESQTILDVFCRLMQILGCPNPCFVCEVTKGCCWQFSVFVIYVDDQKPQAKFKVNTNESRIKKQTQINIEKALEQDPDIFEYDQIYQKLEETKHPKQQQQQAQSKDPKYIAGLMKSAALRQLEFEKRQDRKIQKERELEGDLFHGKEAFVTEAYRKRMEEKQRLEEEERKQDELEGLPEIYFQVKIKLKKKVFLLYPA